MTIETTLIIPAYKAEKYIINCLESVTNQTLQRDRFEVLIVENGPRDSTAQIIEQVLGKIPDLNWRLIYEEYPSLSNARNVGILEARGNWVTWVDVDDWLSPNFLEELTNSARDGVVPLARVVDVDETSSEQTSSPIATQILELEAGRHRPEMLWRSLGFAACKLLPVDQARRLKFDIDLKSGEDVAYFSPFFSKWPQDFDTTPAHNGAVYYRLVRSGSMSRQAATFEFSVSQRLAVMKHLDAAATDAYPELRQIMHSMMRSQTLFSKRYLDENPKDAERVIQAFDAAELKYIPWNMLSGNTNNLAILYNFAPFADASAVVAAKRIVSSGEQWNIINNDMSTIRAVDTALHTRITPYISLQKTLKNPPIFGSWKGISDFCKGGLEAISEIEAKHGTQSRVYSRSMWPASHFLAALYKLQNPQTEWIAEFSDPLRKDVLGNERQGAVKNDEYWLQLESGVKSAGYQIGSHESIFAVCEKLAYALADSIYFTNAHQMTYMMSYLEDVRLAERVSRRSSIMPHPVPPSRFLPKTIHVGSGSVAERVELGYFGSFYPNRGPGVILAALESLNDEFKSNIQLNIFSPNHSELEEELTSYISTGLVVVKPPLPYLDYLEAAKGMDVLLVADADTAASGHRLNPYLPSKLSDYIATGSRVWGLYESGSILSRSNVDYLSRCNDISGAKDVLDRIVGDRK